MLRKTKIICTLGPATEDESVLRRLMLGGMNAARFNFSHCTHEDAAHKLEAVVRLREELGLPVATILDTKGPEIRVKTFKDGPIELEAGDTFTLTTRDVGRGLSGGVHHLQGPAQGLKARRPGAHRRRPGGNAGRARLPTPTSSAPS